MWLWLSKMLNSKLLDIVCDADLDPEECVDDNLVEILNLTFSSRCRNWILVKIPNLNFSQDFDADFRSRFWGMSLIKILKRMFGSDSEAKFWCYLKRIWIFDTKGKSWGEGVDTLAYFRGNQGSRVWISQKCKNMYFLHTRTSWDKYMFNGIPKLKF